MRKPPTLESAWYCIRLGITFGIAAFAVFLAGFAGVLFCFAFRALTQ